MNVYPNDIDLEELIASLPGIKNVSSNQTYYGNKGEPILRYFFYVSNKNDKGLFLLTRCCDRRYWKLGDKWKIELSVGDQYENEQLPICYMLSSGSVIGLSSLHDAIEESRELIKNINYHLNHTAFLEGYDLKREEFRLSYISYLRKEKLKKIKEKEDMRILMESVKKYSKSF